MTTILFDAATVKPAPKTFGKGLHRSLPVYHTPFTRADIDWLRDEELRRELDAHLDDMAREAEARERLEAGCLL